MRPIFKKCLNCGSGKIRLVESDYTTTAGQKNILVPNVRRHECPACGEVLLDYEAVKQIESYRFPIRKMREFYRSA